MARSTGKDHARINLDIWANEDWLDLTPPAQHLYFVLWTSPQLSYCGTGEWRPGKIAAKAKGWTAEAVCDAAVELSRRLFLIIDTETEEFVVRSWIKHDGLWKSPNMAVAMAKSYADLASRTLRGVVVFEVSKLRERHPGCSSWGRDVVVDLLKQKPIDPMTLLFYPGLNPSVNPSANPSVNPSGNPSLNPSSNPSDNSKANPSLNPSVNPGATPSPTPSSLTPTPTGGYVTGERHQSPLNADGTVRTIPDPNEPPQKFCPRHMPSGTADPCRACKHAGIEYSQWLAEQSEARRTEIEALAAARVAERRAAAQTRQDAIDACTLCGPDGYINGATVCDHIDRTQTAANGIAAVRAALAKPHQPDQGSADA